MLILPLFLSNQWGEGKDGVTLRAKSVKEHSISIRSDMERERNHRVLASGVSSFRSCEIEPAAFMFLQ